MADELLSQDEINALLEGTLGSEDGASGGSLSSDQIDSLNGFITFFKDAISSVIGMLAGKDVSVSTGTSGLVGQSEFTSALSDERYLRFSVKCDGFNDVPLAMIMPELGVMMLADLMMGGEGKDLPDEANELFVNAAQEGLSQVMGSAMTSLSGKLDGRKAIPSSPMADMVSDEWVPFDDISSDDSIWRSEIDVSIEGLDSFSCYLAMPVGTASVFADALSGKEEEAAAPQGPEPTRAQEQRSATPAGQPVSSPPPSGGFSQPPQSQSYSTPPVDVRPAEFAPLVSSAGGGSAPSNIDLIADIPVRVTVELGRTRKSVAEILALAPGSMIELDKMAGEPVDILVNGKPIAKGEVVVIDENFGVRITEILNMDSRVKSVGP